MWFAGNQRHAMTNNPNVCGNPQNSRKRRGPRSADHSFEGPTGNYFYAPDGACQTRGPRPTSHETWRPRPPQCRPPPHRPPPTFHPGPPPFRPPGPTHFTPNGPRHMRSHGPPPTYFNSPSSDIYSYENFGSDGMIGGGAHNRHRRGPPHSGPPQKKKKLDSRDKAANNKFYCDTCDRGYKTEETYREHTDGHQQCRFADCTYTAAPKLVHLHIQLQHKTGLAKKVWQGESREEVEKWIIERRRNYPTKDNIERKRIEQREREQRGEVLHTGSWGKMQGKGRNSKPFPERKHESCNGGQSYPAGHGRSQIGQDISTATHNKTGKPGNIHLCSDDPLSLLAGKESKTEESESKKEESSVELAGGLGSLIASYSVSSDEEESKTNTRDHSISKSPPKTKQKMCREKSRLSRQTNNIVSRVKTSLLQKLLANEIRRERNVVLQCVRYVVNNNYFLSPEQPQSDEMRVKVKYEEVTEEVKHEEVTQVELAVSEETKKDCALNVKKIADDAEKVEVTGRMNTSAVDEDMWENA